jgi:hypothetical protein
VLALEFHKKVPDTFSVRRVFVELSRLLVGLSRDIVRGLVAQSNAAVLFSAATLRTGCRYGVIAFGYRGADSRCANDAHYRMWRALLHAMKATLARQGGET